MKYYLLVIDEIGSVETHGPFCSAAERDTNARRIRREMEAELGVEYGGVFIKVCGEVIGRLEVDGYTGMDLL